MIHLTPNNTQRICSAVFIGDYEYQGNVQQVRDHALFSCARDLFHHVADKYATSERDEKMKGTTYRINAVVMSAEEYDDNLRQAYFSGA